MCVCIYVCLILFVYTSTHKKRKLIKSSEKMVRPTEENNSLSANIDVVPLDQMVNIFAQVDYQLFQAWPGTGKLGFYHFDF